MQQSLLTNRASASPCPGSLTGLQYRPVQYCSGKVNFSPTKKRATASRTPTTSRAATLLMIPAQSEGQLLEREQQLCIPVVQQAENPTISECRLLKGCSCCIAQLVGAILHSSFWSLLMSNSRTFTAGKQHVIVAICTGYFSGGQELTSQ